MPPDSSNPVLKALHARRSVPRVTGEQPSRELVQQIIAAAAWAPNHYHTEPWRFLVLVGDARRRLGDVMAESLRLSLDDLDGPEATQLIERERQKPLRAPVVIVCTVVPSDLPKAVEIEDIAATAAGVQNLLLAASALGLGAMWRTGRPAYDPRVKRFLGLPDRSHLLAFVYLGYPELMPSVEHSRDATLHTSWLE